MKKNRLASIVATVAVSAVVIVSTGLSQNRGENRAAFEVISIRPYEAPPRPAGTRGAPGPGGAENGAIPRPAGNDEARRRAAACGGRDSEVTLNPGRFSVTNATVFRLVVLGYGMKNCALVYQMGLQLGGPEWALTESYNIQATIPAGEPVYTRLQLRNGEAPRLQLMIQDMLATRFQLTLRRGSKEFAGFNLVVVNPGKAKRSDDQTEPPPSSLSPARPGATPGSLQRGVMLNCAGDGIEISSWVGCLQNSLNAPIVDKTGFKGLYDIPPLPVSPALNPTGPPTPGLQTADIVAAMGLKLEPARVSLEILTIDHVEKPSEN